MVGALPRRMKSPFRYLNSSPEVIGLAESKHIRHSFSPMFGKRGCGPSI